MRGGCDLGKIRWTRRWLGVAVVCALVALAGCRKQTPQNLAASINPIAVQVPAAGKPFPTLPPTNDPKEILRRMVAVYQQADSLYVSSEAIIDLSFQQPSHVLQTTVLQYKKDPGYLSMKI